MTTQESQTKGRGLFVGGTTLAALIGAGWVGLHVPPAPFPRLPAPASAPDTILLPDGLPAPVERYYRVTYGGRIPIIRSAVLSGRGHLTLNGLAFPMRFRFIHTAERSFRAYFELTAFGAPIMKVNEHYVDGKFRQELPFGVEEGEPKIDHSAAMRMWGEWATWLPAMLLTDPDARWEPLDHETAVLVVPYAAQCERLIIRFDPTTGKLQYFEAMKYKNASDTTKTLWVNAVWFGEKPWANFEVEDIVYNAAVDTSPAAKGP